jgi:hypothetical protein
MIVYRHALLRDLLMRIFAEAEIRVVAAVPEVELQMLSLQGLDPDVIVFDEATADTVNFITRTILCSPTPLSVSKVIVVELGSMITVVCHKEVVNDAGIEDLVAWARGVPEADLAEVSRKNLLGRNDHRGDQCG